LVQVETLPHESEEQAHKAKTERESIKHEIVQIRYGKSGQNQTLQRSQGRVPASYPNAGR
jgi:hypothetical protein